MKVKELADEVGVTADTVRHYTRVGILNPARDRFNGYKQYGAQERDRLRFAVRARALGFTLDDIVEIIRHADRGNSPCPTVRKLIEERFAEIESRFKETQRLYKRMKNAMQAWQTQPDKQPDGKIICGLIESGDKTP